MEEKIQKPISFSLEMLKTIDDLAYQMRISRAEFVRRAVENYIKNIYTK